MEKENFIKRLTELRIDKDVSVRNINLSMRQNSTYIGQSERGKRTLHLRALKNYFCNDCFSF